MSDDKLDIAPGVIRGNDVQKVLAFAKSHQFALPAVNITSSSTINAVLETAVEVNSVVIIQLSHGGCAFYAGYGLGNGNHGASVAGAICAARHVHQLADAYGARVILHTDHCDRTQLPWVDGILDAGEAYYKAHGAPLYNSHMLDLSAERIEKNIDTCKRYLERMSNMGMTLEMELGITGGKEDDADHAGVKKDRLYTRPKDVAYAYQELSRVSDRFTVAAAFGNVHGVYRPGTVELRPGILNDSQERVQKSFNTPEKPLFFVFHGGSGSSLEQIRKAISYGVVKMNVDTDLQWAYWDGVHHHYNEKKEYLQGQIGNPQGEHEPNKDFYDPRKWLRRAEKSFKSRLRRAFEDLNNIDTLR